MTLPPTRHGAGVPTPDGGTSVTSAVATGVCDAASAAVIWSVPVQPDTVAPHGTYHAVAPNGPSVTDAGRNVPAPEREVVSTIVAVEGVPSGFVPITSTGILLNPSAGTSRWTTRIS